MGTTLYGGAPIFFVALEDIVGKRLISLPFSDYQMVEMSLDDARRFIEVLKKIYPGYAIHFKWAGNFGEMNDPHIHVRQHAVYHRISVKSEARMWQEVSGAFRRGVRKAKNHKITLNIGKNKAALKRFYGLFCRHRAHKFKILSPPFLFFEEIYDHFFSTGKGFVLEALEQGHLIAGLLILEYEKGLYYKYGASDLDKLALRPNNFLFWELMKLAGRGNYDYIDLGMSWLTEADKGIVKFKESFGGRAFPIFSILAKGSDENEIHISDTQKMFRELTDILVERTMDEHAFDRLGMLLFKYFT